MTPEELAKTLTMAGFEVEKIEDRSTWSAGVVLGKILEANKHPNADKLKVCQVDIGTSAPLNIVCGASNAKPGIYVAVATIGAYLAAIDLKIKKSKLRGVPSEGMICTLSELGLTKDSEGIESLPYLYWYCHRRSKNWSFTRMVKTAIGSYRHKSYQ